MTVENDWSWVTITTTTQEGTPNHIPLDKAWEYLNKCSTTRIFCASLETYVDQKKFIPGVPFRGCEVALMRRFKNTQRATIEPLTGTVDQMASFICSFVPEKNDQVIFNILLRSRLKND